MTRPGKRTWPRREIWVPVLLFLVALGLRLLFWQATPDAAAPYPAYYKGDAPSWLAYARALQESQVFELGLPLRPPVSATCWRWCGTVKKQAYRPSGSCGACWVP